MTGPSSEFAEQSLELSIDALAMELAKIAPKPTDYFTPDNLKEVGSRFLSGDRQSIREATYSKLDGVDFDQKKADYDQLLQQILTNPNVPTAHHRIYEAFVDYQLKIIEMMRSATLFRNAPNEEQRVAAKDAYTTLNVEVYGNVDPAIATSMAKEILDDSTYIEEPTIARIRQELMQGLPAIIKDNLDSAQPIPKPSAEAQEMVKRIVEHLYPNLLRHADKFISQRAQEQGLTEVDLKFEPQDIK